ncbi:MAG: primosomal protein N' [Deltaproteobacteria bacterium]|nr:primosomal protein N' [Deltaproteobacteria bacterium]
MSDATAFAEVGVPVPLGQRFTYAIPASLAGRVVAGARVLCEFGRRKLAGVVLAVRDDAAGLDPARVKPLVAVLDAEPVLPGELLQFLEELARYYVAPIGEVLRLALPAVEREVVRELEAQGELLPGEGPARTRQVGRPVLLAQATDRVEEPGRLRGQAAAVLAWLRGNGPTFVSELSARHGNARAALRKLVELELVTLERRSGVGRGTDAEELARDAPPELLPAQRAAVDAIGAALGRSEGFLLFGVTGSGKTEVYMHAIARCREQGRGALVLVPEIALTPQLLGRFRARFGDEVGVLHSALPEAARHRMWQRLRSGELRIAVGARSALFAPVRDLGLVIVDEEHDGSFKQEEGVRYHARDMALLRAHRASAVTVLGSATPSLESVALVRRGKLTELTLPERATRAAMPSVEIIDLRRFGPGPSGERLLSLPLHRALEKCLEAGEQAIVFLNRRGFAPAVLCQGCGVVQSCKLCSVALTYHRRDGSVRCHYCDSLGPLPERCPACSGVLTLEGLGTERLEAALAEAFPAARVGRLDRDVAAGAKSARIIERMRRGELDILVGTQMVTKGHDLPRVTLVGVVNADAALSIPDFRASERGFQLLVQVAGRAGRHERSGRVLIQTYNPDHPAVVCAARHDVPAFLEGELRERQEVGYPPFRRLALVRVSAVDEGVARQAAGRLAAVARKTASEVEVIGPAPAPIARQRNRFRFRVMLRARDRAPLRAVLLALARFLPELHRDVRVVLDVDPVSML